MAGSVQSSSLITLGATSGSPRVNPNFFIWTMIIPHINHRAKANNNAGMDIQRFRFAILLPVCFQNDSSSTSHFSILVLDILFTSLSKKYYNPIDVMTQYLLVSSSALLLSLLYKAAFTSKVTLGANFFLYKRSISDPKSTSFFTESNL